MEKESEISECNRGGGGITIAIGRESTYTRHMIPSNFSAAVRPIVLRWYFVDGGWTSSMVVVVSSFHCRRLAPSLSAVHTSVTSHPVTHQLKHVLLSRHQLPNLGDWAASPVKRKFKVPQYFTFIMLCRSVRYSISSLLLPVEFCRHSVCRRHFAYQKVAITVSKNDTDVAHYNFNPHQLILVTCGINVAERVHYRTHLLSLLS